MTNGRRSANGVIGLKVPKAVIKAKCARYMQHGKPVGHRELTNFDDYAIIASYGAATMSRSCAGNRPSRSIRPSWITCA